jgi:hypothetical protein
LRLKACEGTECKEGRWKEFMYPSCVVTGILEITMLCKMQGYTDEANNVYLILKSVENDTRVAASEYHQTLQILMR